MMGHRPDLESGDAVDALTKLGEAWHHWRPGHRKAIKQQLGKRARRNARLALRLSQYGRDYASIRNLWRSRLVGPSAHFSAAGARTSTRSWMTAGCLVLVLTAA
jgi:hypothetical protein